MRKILSITSLLCLLITASFAQGINFEQGTWKEVVAKAKTENKIIFIDLYATWCGPCKKMDKETFADPTAGKYYNENFVNYKIDAEKGEGIDLAKKYEVKAYPTTIYIDATTEKPITTELGFCDASQFIERGKAAIAEKNDPMQWADYQKKFKSGNYDEVFLRQMIKKGINSKQNIDPQIDQYIAKFAPVTPNDETIMYIIQNVQTLDNQGVKYVVDYIVAQNAMQELDRWLPEYYEPTLDKAVKTKSMAPLKQIETYATMLNPTQAPSIYNNYVTQYYLKTNDKKNYWVSLNKEMDILMQKPDATYQAEDKAALNEIIGQYKMQLAQYGVPESEHETQINDALAQKPETKISVSFMAASQFNEAFGTLAAEKTIDKTVAKNIELWGTKMMQLVASDPQYAAFFSVNYAKALNKINKKAEAKKLLNDALTQTSGNEELQKVINEALSNL